MNLLNLISLLAEYWQEQDKVDAGTYRGELLHQQERFQAEVRMRLADIARLTITHTTLPCPSLRMLALELDQPYYPACGPDKARALWKAVWVELEIEEENIKSPEPEVYLTVGEISARCQRGEKGRWITDNPDLLNQLGAPAMKGGRQGKRKWPLNQQVRQFIKNHGPLSVQ
ncbi:MAG: hypothetical protein IAF94_27055 [Pirellulaceae bacterium]|nr:hypothetical protein [Pirellulaceae bacterium]